MNVGMIGTGAIGLPMAKQLVDHGIDLKFYARRENVIAELQEYGAHLRTIAQLGAECDAVVVIPNTYPQCLECVNELLTTMRSGQIIVMSTIGPDEVRELQRLCAEQGVALISAPVTGGVAGAKNGTLTIITAGDKQLIDDLGPVFNSFGNNIVYTGEDVGLSAVMKLLVQLLVGINTAATSEVLTLGTKCGLDPDLIYSTICASAGVTKIFQNRANTMIDRNFVKRGTVDILAKDLHYGVELAYAKSCVLLLGQACANVFEIGANTLENTEEDFSAIVKVYEKWSNTTVEHCGQNG